MSNVNRRRAFYNLKEPNEFKVWQGYTLNKFGALTPDNGGYATDFIELTDLHAEKVLNVYTGLTHPSYMNPAQDLLAIRCVVFYDSNKHLLYTDGLYEDPMPPSFYTLDRTRTIDKTILSKLLSAAGANTPLYVRMSVVTPEEGYLSLYSNTRPSRERVYSVPPRYTYALNTEETHNITLDLQEGIEAPPIEGYPIPHGQPLVIGFTTDGPGEISVTSNINGSMAPMETTTRSISNTVYSNKTFTFIEIPLVNKDITIAATIAK